MTESFIFINILFFARFNLPVCRHQAGQGKTVFCKGTRLVGQYNRCRTQCLYGGQVPYQHILFGQQEHAFCQGNAGNYGQSFRDGCYSPCNGCLQHKVQIFAGQPARNEKQQGKTSNKPDESGRQLPQFFIKWYFIFGCSCYHARDITYLGIHTRTNNHGLCFAAAESSTFVQHIRAVGNTGIFFHGLSLFFHRNRFARQGRLINL